MLQNIIIYYTKCTLCTRKYIRTCILSRTGSYFLSHIFLAHRSSKPLFPSFLLGLPFAFVFSIMTLLFTKVSQCPSFCQTSCSTPGFFVPSSPRASLYPLPISPGFTCKHLEGRWLCNT